MNSLSFIQGELTNMPLDISTRQIVYIQIYTRWTNKYEFTLHYTGYRVTHTNVHISLNLRYYDPRIIYINNYFQQAKRLTDLSHTVLYRENPQLMDFQIMAHSSLRITL